MSVIDNNGAGETIEDVKKQLDEANTKLASATGELIDDRKKRAEAEAARDALQLKLTEALDKNKPGEGAQPDARAVVQEVLAERDKEDAATNRKAAEDAFKAANTDYSAANDPGGVKFTAIAEKFAKFNTSGVLKTEDFLKLYQDAAVLANPSKPVIREVVTPYANNTPASGSGPRESDGKEVSARENEIITRLGWTKEQFLAQKAKRPHYVASLLKNLD